MKGLVCAGGEATRLGELTRVANKHLLPVGRWPMIYYPLQLLERAGLESVLVVTGKGHAGQMIDLLGDGRLSERGTGEPLLSLDLTYKVQTQSGGIAQVVGMARDFVRGEKLVVVLGDNIFERSQAAAIEAWAEGGDRALIFVKDVPDPENFGVVVYDGEGRVTDIVEKAGVVDTRRRLNFPTRHPLNGGSAAQADVVLALEAADIANVARQAKRRDAQVISITAQHLFQRSNYQDFQRYAEVDLSDAGQPQHVERPAGGDDHPGGDELDQQLLPGRGTDQVVGDADQEDQQHAEAERQHLLGRDHPAPDVVAHHRPGAAGDGDPDEHRHPAQPRNRPRVAAAPLRALRRPQGAHQPRQPCDRRHQHARHHARDERGEGDQQQG